MQVCIFWLLSLSYITQVYRPDQAVTKDAVNEHLLLMSKVFFLSLNFISDCLLVSR